MYKQITRNKVSSVLFMLAFVALFGLIGGLVGLMMQDYMISMWIILGVLAYVIIQYFFSSQLAIAATHAKPLTFKENPRLFRLVENTAITIGIPTPKIYIIQDNAPNAFAAGRNPNEAILGFTTGLLNTLNKTELEGVISHEMGHIRNYDIRFKTIIFAMVAAIALLVDIAFRAFFVRSRDARALIPIWLVAIVIIVVIWPVSNILKAAAGRSREYLADATGAEITRYPEGLASALEKISDYSGPPLFQSSSASMLFLDNPERKPKNGFLKWVDGLFATHPPIEERIERLRNMGFEEPSPQ